MNILGIDYGRKKIGLALGDSESKLTEPLEVIRFKSENEMLEKMSRLSEESRVSKIVVGIPEGAMAVEVRKFGDKLQKEIGIPVFYQDETLSTKDAQDLSRVSGMTRKKRKQMEDAYSASLILQKYLDEF